jgi:hypothetical protein
LIEQNATIAQLVEQTIRNRQVKSSTLFGGSTLYADYRNYLPNRQKNPAPGELGFSV